jgi:acetylornithine deacetylase/succinyl-diaminopimelate desuccinylase-like protein
MENLIMNNIEDIQSEFLDELAKLVEIPSVIDENPTDTPFGKEIHNALN